MWNFLAAQGKALIHMYIEGLLHVPPREVAEYFTDTMVSICVAFREDNVAYQWLEAALVQVPINVFTDENKLRLLKTIRVDSGDEYFRQSSLQ